MAAIPLLPPVGASAGPESAGWSRIAARWAGCGVVAGRSAASPYEPTTTASAAPSTRAGRMRRNLGRGSVGAATAVIVVGSDPLFGCAGRHRMPLRGGRGPALPQGRGRQFGTPRYGKVPRYV